MRDGVDVPLASLFLEVAGPSSSMDGEIERARSASDVFLYRRLETLPETKGRFRLNVELPISFDARSRMEADLLCHDARVVVEIDGAQHLTGAVYRRDRRKGQLLQENGYLVLRFLAEDLGKELDTVLDAILRAVSRRRHVIPVRQSDTLSVALTQEA